MYSVLRGYVLYLRAWACVGLSVLVDGFLLHGTCYPRARGPIALSGLLPLHLERAIPARVGLSLVAASCAQRQGGDEVCCGSHVNPG